MSKALWPMLAGFTLWALAFIVLYTLQYLGCRFAWPASLHRATLIGAYVAILAVLAGYAALQFASLRKRRSSATAVHRIGSGTTIAALAATAVTFGPVAFVSMCT
ncbi:hypothetical protein [Devosia sp.]|uniref:hypothetical protein n=1 Tax=Devosia sp. TaxID=1871048 RepID=UPI003A9280DB